MVINARRLTGGGCSVADIMSSRGQAPRRGLLGDGRREGKIMKAMAKAKGNVAVENPELVGGG